MNRQVAGRSGETMCLYSWITNTSPRATVLPAPPTAARTDILTVSFSRAR
ncbi:hypothetical protein MSG_04983 [Mycobacterium shigaense]|uniref:Uncharacterized protein n=1 Tax=Mycobacterium shigaense TaxID=722731 RepID=A0A1Z4EQ34_9MYCO|nr:hypothetical protein MSG_04983 [Mycobacterium shigaense]